MHNVRAQIGHVAHTMVQFSRHGVGNHSCAISYAHVVYAGYGRQQRAPSSLLSKGVASARAQAHVACKGMQAGELRASASQQRSHLSRTHAHVNLTGM